MRRYSPPYQSPPRRGYGGGGRHRSPPPRRGGEGRQGSLLVRNIPLDCRPEELRVPFERFGVVRDVYLPKDYHTGQPRGFAFVQFVDAYEAAEAQYQMNGRVFAGREISVVVASEARKRPEDMRRRTRTGGPSDYGGRRPSYRGNSRSRSRSRSPRYGSRSRQRSRSSSPAPRGRGGYSISPDRRQSDRPRHSRDHQEDRQPAHHRRSYSPGYVNGADHNVDSYEKKTDREAGDESGQRRSPPAKRASRSPSGSRSRSADISPEHFGPGSNK